MSHAEVRSTEVRIKKKKKNDDMAPVAFFVAVVGTPPHTRYERAGPKECSVLGPRVGLQSRASDPPSICIPYRSGGVDVFPWLVVAGVTCVRQRSDRGSISTNCSYIVSVQELLDLVCQQNIKISVYQYNVLHSTNIVHILKCITYM